MNGREAKLAAWGAMCAYAGVFCGEGYWVTGLVVAVLSVAVRLWAECGSSATAALRGKGG